MILERRWSVAAFPFVLAVLACGRGTETDGATASALPGNPAAWGHSKKLEVYGRDITAGWANVGVMHHGLPVNDASVVVNGQVIPRSSSEDGLYSGQLETTLSAGDVVFLEVARGHSKVAGKGTMPDSPVLTSPSPGANLSPGEDVVVTWTSPSEPDYFVVSAQWSCGTGCGSGTRFDVDRSARSFTIPASALPSGQDVVVNVFAYNDGKLHRQYTPHVPYPGMNIRAESNAVTLIGAVRPKLAVYGRDMGAPWVNVSVVRDGAWVTDASVMVNGQVIPFWREGVYSSMLDVPVSTGGTLSLEVTSGPSVVHGSGTVPDAPVLTSPPWGTVFPRGSGITVTWTSPSEPDYFAVVAQWSCGPVCGAGRWFEADRSARALTIPAGAVPYGKDITLSVFAYNDGTLGGDYTPWAEYPGMNIRAESGEVTVRY